MRYTKFQFKNFKGIEDLSIDLTGDVTTLVGLNESGKTTILEAICCFEYGSEDLQVINPGFETLRDPEQWIPISKRANFNEIIQIIATVELDETDRVAYKKHMQKNFGLRLSEAPTTIEIAEKHSFENSRSKATNRIWNLAVEGTKGQQRNPRRYGANTLEWQGAIAYLKDELPRIWYFPNFLFELPERFALTGLERLDDEERDRNSFYREIFAKVLATQGNNADLETHVVERLDSTERADRKSLEAVLLGMGRSITQTVFDGWNRIFGRAPSAQEIQINATSDGGTAFLELQIKGPDGYFDLSERSLGFRWFFMFLLMTSYSGPSAERSRHRPLFLLDEPASNLHSSAQAELLKSFDGLTERCHLMYTTHSHHLIDLRWLESAYVVKNEALGSLAFEEYLNANLASNTSIAATPYRRFVNENPSQTSYFQPVLDLLDYRPSNLEPVPDVVLVEGKSDFYLLRYVSEVLQIGPECPPLIPGSGAGSLDTVIRLYIGWGKDFEVLLDGDAAGKKQRARYSELFEPALKGRCSLLPELCEDAGSVEAESLLSPADSTRIIDAVYLNEEGRPSAKKALSRAVCELYARGEKVQLDEETVTRLTILLEALRRKLDR